MPAALPEVVPIEPDSDAPLWPWIAAALSALVLGETARRWFWPKLALGCEIAAGPSTLTGASSPPITAPELRFDIRIEQGEASSPIGRPVLTKGENG